MVEQNIKLEDIEKELSKRREKTGNKKPERIGVDKNS